MSEDNKELDKKIDKELQTNELIEEIYKNCVNKSLRLIICKPIKGLEFLENLDINDEFYYVKFEKDDPPVIEPYNPKYHLLEYNTESASFFGKKDFNLEFSYYKSRSDYPYDNISQIQDYYDKVQELKQTIENLENNNKFKDVELMCPQCRMIGNDTYIIGFNEA